MLSPNVTLASLASNHDGLQFCCPDCGANVVAPIDKVLMRFGPEATIEDVQAPLVCKHCGNIEIRIHPRPRACAAEHRRVERRRVA